MPSTHASMYGSLGFSLVINLSRTLGTLTRTCLKRTFLLFLCLLYTTLNTLISECLERHAPLRKVRVTRPPAPWMKDPLIEELQKKRDAARFTAHQTSTDAAWHEFRSVRNKLKSAIGTARKAFIEKALYSNKSREVWKVIHRVLKPSARPLRFDPNELNGFFTKTAQRTLETRATPIEDLRCLTSPQGVYVFSCHLSPVRTFSRSSRIYDQIVIRARIRYLPSLSRWYGCWLPGSPPNIYYQQLHCESLFSKVSSGVSSPKDWQPSL